MAEELKDPFGNRISFASTNLVYNNEALTQKLLTAIGRAMDANDPADWAKQCWISDISSISDFGLEIEGVQKVSEEVGVPISENDYLHTILTRMESVKEPS
jgi:hypothetical protein